MPQITSVELWSNLACAGGARLAGVGTFLRLIGAAWKVVNSAKFEQLDEDRHIAIVAELERRVARAAELQTRARYFAATPAQRDAVDVAGEVQPGQEKRAREHEAQKDVGGDG